MNIAQILSQTFSATARANAAAVRLLDDDSDHVSFIARYRKATRRSWTIRSCVNADGCNICASWKSAKPLFKKHWRARQAFRRPPEQIKPPITRLSALEDLYHLQANAHQSANPARAICSRWRTCCLPSSRRTWKPPHKATWTKRPRCKAAWTARVRFWWSGCRRHNGTHRHAARWLWNEAEIHAQVVGEQGNQKAKNSAIILTTANLFVRCPAIVRYDLRGRNRAWWTSRQISADDTRRLRSKANTSKSSPALPKFQTVQMAAQPCAWLGSTKIFCRWNLGSQSFEKPPTPTITVFATQSQRLAACCARRTAPVPHGLVGYRNGVKCAVRWTTINELLDTVIVYLHQRKQYV